MRESLNPQNFSSENLEALFKLPSESPEADKSAAHIISRTNARLSRAGKQDLAKRTSLKLRPQASELSKPYLAAVELFGEITFALTSLMRKYSATPDEVSLNHICELGDFFTHRAARWLKETGQAEEMAFASVKAERNPSLSYKAALCACSVMLELTFRGFPEVADDFRNISGLICGLPFAIWYREHVIPYVKL